jgi:hypothetical protein
VSRVSLQRRLDAIRNALLPAGSIERRISDLPDRERGWHDAWRNECAALINSAENEGDPGTAYGRYISGSLRLPQLEPASLRAKIFPADWRMSDRPPSEIYHDIINEGSQR